MGKFNFGISSEDASAELGEGFYSGDCPPKGNYTCLVKQAKVKKNKNNDNRMSVLLEIQEPEGSEKAQYNGYGFFNGLNVTPQGMPWVNNFLDAIGADRKKFAAGDVTISNGTVDQDTAQDVLKIGTRKVVGHTVRVSVKVRPYNGEDQLDVIRYLLDGEEDDDVTPDEDAAGLDDSDDDATDEADEAGDDAEEGEEEEGDGYTQEELDELLPADLKAICDDWGVAYAAKATKATLIKAILKFQEEAAEESGEESEEGEDESGEEESEDLSEEDLAEMSLKDLTEYIEGKGWDLPKKKVPSVLRKAILQYQAEPPF